MEGGKVLGRKGDTAVAPVDNRTDAHDFSTGLLHKLDDFLDGTARGDNILDDKDPFAGAEAL